MSKAKPSQRCRLLSIPSDHVAFFRTQRANRYVDAVTISDEQDTTAGTWNRTTKQYDGASPTVLYTGGALIRPAGAGTKNRGEVAAPTYDYDVQLPFDAGAFRANNLVTVTASESAPELVGVTMKVQSDAEDSYNTHRLLRCVLVEERDRG